VTGSKHLLEGEHVEPVSLPLISEQAPVSVQEGQSVWDVTQEQMRQLRLPTAEEVQAIREMAQREGFREGEKAGVAAGQQKIQQAVKSLAAVMNQMAEPLGQRTEDVITVFAQLLQHLIEQVVQRELLLDSAQVHSLVEQALSLVDVAQHPVTVRLNPTDAEKISGSELLQERIQVQSDPSIQPGGCMVKTACAQVDATVKARLDQVVEQLYQNLQVKEPPSE